MHGLNANDGHLCCPIKTDIQSYDSIVDKWLEINTAGNPAVSREARGKPTISVSF
jgi:hypothetical protein